jgi:uridine kinase
MIGDKLVIKDYHRKGAELVFAYIESTQPQIPFALTVSGESGSGKSEIAHCIKELLEASQKTVTILGQDDYFRLPPHSNHQQRKNDLSWVGPREVQLDLMDYHISKLLDPQGLVVVKPLVHFEENIISTEAVQGPFDVVIAEGTYTALLAQPSVKAFINRDFRETKKDRLARNRDQALENGQDQALTFLEEVLTIEHEEIKQHKELASLVIPAPHDI